MVTRVLDQTRKNVVAYIARLGHVKGKSVVHRDEMISWPTVGGKLQLLNQEITKAAAQTCRRVASYGTFKENQGTD
jgi:hypothetical protein